LQGYEYSSFDLSVFDLAELNNLRVHNLDGMCFGSVTTSSKTKPDAFLAKSLNQVVVIVGLYTVTFDVLDSLSEKGKIELVRI
jgi:hypothetical protein